MSGRAQVNVNGGTVNTIYCGGKGAWDETVGCKNDSVAGSVGSTELNLNSGTVTYVYGGGRRAIVQGDAIVNVGQSITEGDITVKGAVYGCNRYKGSPKGNVYVNVYKTAHVDTNQAAYTGSNAGFAIAKLFGGGAEADYKPNTGKQIYLTVYGCQNTIKDVYGGGDAAAVQKTTTVIEGGRFDRVFAGGNGEKIAANVNDSAILVVKAGRIRQLFGGSNQRGSIAHVAVNINAENVSDGCPEQIDEFFGGSNEADLTGDLTTTIECGTKFGTVYGGSNKADIDGNVTLNIRGGEFNEVYGGSKGDPDPGEGASPEARAAASADISGNVTLNISGGKITNAFGGSNINGSIGGRITVNVQDTSVGCDFDLTNVYGGGNLATYTGDPYVNIKQGTIKQNVYGGGKGVLASDMYRGLQGLVTGNPHVTIGDDTAGHIVKIGGDVYGGGDVAHVAGVPVVVVKDCDDTISNLYGGGNAADVNGSNVNIYGGTITHAYGGGHGDKNVTTEPLKYADVRGPVTFNIYGGTLNQVFAGSNSKGDMTGSVALNINKNGNCPMYIGEVYGGGNEAAGRAGTITIGCTGDLVDGADGHIAHPENIGTTLEGIQVVYGGANKADVTNTDDGIALTINGGIINHVFGGNNVSGAINGTIQVNVNNTNNTCGWYVGDVYGGGNKAWYGGTPNVNIQAGTIYRNVYGGGNNITESGKGVAGSDVQMSGGTVMGDLYGGCNQKGTVEQNSSVIITGGTVTNIYGGGLGVNTVVTGKANVDISGNAHIVTDVYGGGNEGVVNGGADVKIH